MYMQAARVSVERVVDLHRKLTISSQLCDRLSMQNSELRNNLTEKENELQRSVGDSEVLRQKYAVLLSNNEQLSSENTQLRSTLSLRQLDDELNHAEGGAVTTAMQSALDKRTAEVVELQARVMQLEKQLTLANEESIAAQKRYEILHYKYDSCESARDKLKLDLDAATSSVNSLTRQLNELHLANRDRQQALEMKQLELSYTEKAQTFAAEASHRADEKWRKLDEMLKSRERELGRLQEERIELEQNLAMSDKRFELAESKWGEREALLRAEFEYQLQLSNARVKPLLDEISAVRSTITSEQLRYEAMIDSMTGKTRELEGEITVVKASYENKLVSLQHLLDVEKANGIRVCEEFEAVKADHKVAVAKLMKVIEDADRAYKSLHDALVARGSKFVVTLELLQSAVRSSLEEASDLKLRNLYLTSQFNKLVSIITNLSSTSNTSGGSASPGLRMATSDGLKHSDLDDSMYGSDIVDTVPLALRPIRIYGDEIRKAYIALSNKIVEQSSTIAELQAELRSTKHSLEGKALELEHTVHDLDISNTKFSTLRGQFAALEMQFNDQTAVFRDQLQSMQQAKDVISTRAEKSEHRTVELANKLAQVQSELSRSNAELNAIKVSYSSDMKRLGERSVALEEEKDALRSELSALKTKCDSYIAQAKAESEKRIRIRDELQRCRDVAQETAQSFHSERERSQEQLRSMSAVLAQYENQIRQKDSLLRVLKQQREELSSTLQKQNRGGTGPSSSSGGISTDTSRFEDLLAATLTPGVGQDNAEMSFADFDAADRAGYGASNATTAAKSSQAYARSMGNSEFLRSAVRSIRSPPHPSSISYPPVSSDTSVGGPIYYPTPEVLAGDDVTAQTSKLKYLTDSITQMPSAQSSRGNAETQHFR
jgi:chromosome segregation ATPase